MTPWVVQIPLFKNRATNRDRETIGESDFIQ